MAEVWLHHNPGFWYVTRDGMNDPECVKEIWLRDVRFVIDPVGEERARQASRRVTYAWARGIRIAPRDDDFGLSCGIALDPHSGFIAAELFDKPEVLGAVFGHFSLAPDLSGLCNLWLWEKGRAERRRVQQYGRQK